MPKIIYSLNISMSIGHPLGYAQFDSEDIGPPPKRGTGTRRRKVKSSIKSKQARRFLNALPGFSTDKTEEDEDNNLADFHPTTAPPAAATAAPLPDPAKNVPGYGPQHNDEERDGGISPQAYSQLDSSASIRNYYNQYLPYYTQAANTSASVHGSGDELMTKLNYMITLLEGQKDEKTDSVTEELVLYTFLGVFVIFIVDSFARAGKYTR